MLNEIQYPLALHATVLTLLIGGTSRPEDIWQLGRYVLVGALAVALGAQVTLLGAQAIHPHNKEGAAMPRETLPQPVLPPRPLAYDVPTLIAANLFGTAEDSSAPIAEGTEWDLLGVIAADGGDHGIAILAQKGQTPHVYAVGDQPVEGATLTKVLPDRVLLSWGNRKEEVVLPHTHLTGTADTPVKLVQNVSAAGTSASYGVANPERRKEIESLRAAEPSPVLTTRPVMQNGHVSGLMVAPAGNAEAFAALGLRPRDIITNVNGEDANGIASGVALARSLENGVPVSVTVLRGGRPVQLSLASNRDR